LLVLGGSGGARSLNENVPKALYKIRRQLSNWQIVHQSGEADREATESLYRKFDLPAAVVPFVGDMPGTLSETDLAVCRAGGTTLAELSVMGVPAVLLPYPHAADDHQAANARHFSAGGGCVTIDEREISDRLDDRLADMLCFLLANDALRRRMSASMLELAKPSATADVAELVWSIVSSRSLQSAAA
jgi:UDP-N-acetylglucosamine--N-acetylmuramyl-(pentapeptide) pyrophosphoryl-undecaprenol N-acetylglucosamine transferase